MKNLTPEQQAAEYAVCHTCQSQGTRHCAHPEECGSVKTYPNELLDMVIDKHSRGVSLSIIAEHAFDMGYNAAQPKWVDVKDRLPEEGGRYLCVVEEINDLGKSRFVWNCYFDDRDCEFRDSHQKMVVTHWMPLPPLPTTEV